MLHAPVPETEVSPALVLRRLVGWTSARRGDPCPGAVADVLVGFAFLVGLQAAVRSPEAAHVVLASIAKEQPSAYRKSAALARPLFDPEMTASC